MRIKLCLGIEQHLFRAFDATSRFSNKVPLVLRVFRVDTMIGHGVPPVCSDGSRTSLGTREGISSVLLHPRDDR
ncbi:hypothetical protein CK230_09095 [Mesorhizobium sp. WSM3859]|nr:hypothetical protein CK230_09095 [Mesorhizobium sp. WSM3859]